MKKRFLLVGGGHAHAIVLAGLAKRPLQHAEVTLVSPDEKQPYSGMVPGYLAGHYALDEITIDVQRLAARAGVQFVRGTAAALDAAGAKLRLEDGRALEYDILSLDVGAGMRAPFPGASHGVPVRPIGPFLEKASAPGRRNLAVIGAGPAGAELAMALAYRGERVTVYGEAAPDPRVLAALERNAVSLRIEEVRALEAGPVVVTKNTKRPFDLAVLATGPAAPSWLRAAGLALDEQGFVLVERTMRSASHANVFAVGDCATVRGAPHAKSGVFAVRQARVLASNLERAAVGELPAARYTPQRRSLMLISCGGKHAIAQWGVWSAEGEWVWRVKDAIDRRWIAHHSQK